MKLTLQREWPAHETTLGELFIDEDPVLYCRTLEDMIREIYGEPVHKWKINDRTAVPAGIYELGLVDSPRFGNGTIALLDVPGFSGILMHSVSDARDTRGCIGVGQNVHRNTVPPSITGGKSLGVLDRLKKLVADRIHAGEECKIEILNPAGWGQPRSEP